MNKIYVKLLREVKKKNDFTTAQNNYGVFLFNLKRYNEALLQFEKAAADLDYDGRALALVNVGRTSIQLGHKVRAKAAFEHATVIDRKLPEAFIELAAINFEEQEYAAAFDTNPDFEELLDAYKAKGGGSNDPIIQEYDLKGS